MSGRASCSSSNARRTALIAAAGTSVAVGGFLLARAVHSRRRNNKSLPLPRARRSDHSDEYFGQTVADPYRWLEKSDDDETKAWVESQTKHTDAYFESELEPSREKFFTRLEEVYKHDKYSSPWRVGDYWFFYLQTGLSNQSVMYKQLGLDGTPEPLLDPNTLGEDGTNALGGADFSDDGKMVVYGINKKGSDWFSLHVKNVETGEDLPDFVEWCKFGSMAWEKEARGFFYSSYVRPKALEVEGKSAGTEVESAKGHKVMYHQLGTDSSKDQLVYQSPLDEKWLASAVITGDLSTLLISIGDSCDPVTRLFYRDLSSFDGQDVDGTMGKIVKLVDNFDSLYQYVTNEGRTFWFRSNMDAPKYKVVKMQLPPVGSPMEEDEAALAQIPKTTVVAEDPTGVLNQAVAVAGDRLVLGYERDAFVQLELCNLRGGLRQTIEVPGIGAISGVSADKRYDHIMFKFMNFVTPGIIYRGTVKRRSEKTTEEEEERAAAASVEAGCEKPLVRLEVFRETEVPGICTDDFETKQIRYKSKDGTMIPMFVVGRKGDQGASPCLLYGYGGFNISLTPTFSTARLLFIKHFGARFCVANIRGGGEYGEEWHSAGTLQNKQNVFDDFVYAAKHLMEIGHTTNKQLAIMGGSNGGLLVGACVNQQPDMFAVGIAQVGVMDMLRFDEFTIGYAWRSDYGSSRASEEQFRTLLSYSPLHNVDPKSPPYPAMLLTTGDHDDRVCPLHSYKYIAELQHTIGSRPGEKPLLIRIDRDSGHGGGKPTAKVLAEAADTFAFIAKHTGATWEP